MAYFLRAGPTSSLDYVQLAAPISIPAGADFEIEFKIQATNSDNLRVFGNLGNFGNRVLISPNNNPNVQINTSSTGTTFSAGSDVNAINLHTYKLVRVANRISLFIDDTQRGNDSFNNGLLVFDVLFTQNTANAGRCGSELYFFKVRDSSGNLIHNYDPSASNGTGTTLIDTVGGNNGTLINFPTDNSQWVFYDDSPVSDDVDATIAITMPQLTVNATGQSTAPALSASVAVTMPQLSVSASGSSVAPGIAASVAVTMPQFIASATGQQSLPDGGATVFFTMPQFAVSASGQQTVPQFSATVAATMPQFTVNASASATEPGFVASVAYTMPQLSVAAQGQTEAPDYVASASITMPQFSVTVLVGDIVFGSAIGTRTDLPKLSRRVNVLALSRHTEYNKLSTHTEWRR